MKAHELKAINVPPNYGGFDVIVNRHVPPGEVWVVQAQRPGTDCYERILIINNLGVFRAHHKWYTRLWQWLWSKLTGSMKTIFIPDKDDVPT